MKKLITPLIIFVYITGYVFCYTEQRRLIKSWENGYSKMDRIGGLVMSVFSWIGVGATELYEVIDKVEREIKHLLLGKINLVVSDILLIFVF